MYCFNIFIPCFCITAIWLKIQGDDVGNQPSVTKATSGLQLPGSRSGSASWLEQDNLLWMFGGVGYDASFTDQTHKLNDLWLYNISSKQWNLVHEGRASNITLNGTRVVPKPRRGALACGVPGILLIIFGGESYDNEKLFDTWLYRFQNRSWIPLLYATDNAANHPPARTDPSVWCMNDRIVMYGGVGRNGILLEDLWQFSLRDLQWSYLRQHSNSTNKQGEPIFPGLRMGGATWMLNNHLLMFGGSRNSATTELYLQPSESLLSDMWQYDISTNTWSLLQQDQAGSDKDTDNFPTGRLFAGSVISGTLLYLFSGYGIDHQQGKPEFLLDLWQYDLNTRLWTGLLWGASETDGISNSHTMLPTPRCDATVWYNKNVLYLFGGFGHDKKKHIAVLNDLYVNVKDRNMLADFVSPSESIVNRFIKELPPYVIFAICFGTFGGIVLIFGAVFCMKKMIDFPNHGPIKLRNYNRKDVKYTRVEEDINIDM